MEVKWLQVQPEERTEVMGRVKKEEFDEDAETVRKGFVKDVQSVKKEESHDDIASASPPASGCSCQSTLTKPTPVHGRSGPTRRSSKGGWKAEEDEILCRMVKQFGGRNWKKIAESFQGRTDVQCLHRWHKVLNPELIKGAWTKEEDERIIELINKYGTKKWSIIASGMRGRIGKQCRERWHNHLNPGIKKGAWTTEEELMLIRAHQMYGNKWAEISKLLPGRTDNSIKNHWNCSVKKKLDSYLSSGLLVQEPEISYALNLNGTAPAAAIKSPTAFGRSTTLETPGSEEISRHLEADEHDSGRPLPSSGAMLRRKSSSRVDFSFCVTVDRPTPLESSRSWEVEMPGSAAPLTTEEASAYSCEPDCHRQTRASAMVDPKPCASGREDSPFQMERPAPTAAAASKNSSSSSPPSPSCEYEEEDKYFRLQLQESLLDSLAIMPDLSAPANLLQGISLNLKMSPRSILGAAARSFKNIPSILGKRRR